MVRHCFVLNCKSDSRTDSSIFYRIPSIISKKNKRYASLGEAQQAALIKLSVKRRQAWVSAFRRGELNEQIIMNARICGRHFLSGKPADLQQENHPDWVPNKNLGYKVGVALKRKLSLERYDRYTKRVKLTTTENTTSVNILPDDHGPDVGVVADIIPTADDHGPDVGEVVNFPTKETFTNTKTVGTQTDLTINDVVALMEQLTITKKNNDQLSAKLFNLDISLESFENNNEKTKYFTGLTDYRLLFLIHDTIASKLYSRSNASLSTSQQLLLTIMKLRLNLPFKFLSYRFGVAIFTISRYFRRCLHVLYCTFKNLIHWPDRETLQSTMPACFRECFGKSITTIVDCFEIFIESPSNLCSSAQCWSNYKHHKTAKILLSSSPQGSVMYVSDSYGGRASDDYITQDCGFLKFITPGDIVLADRGFQVEEVLNLLGSTLKVPAFTRGKKQLHPVELEETRKVANVRIHIERVIGSLRQTYTILSGTVPITLLCTQENGVCVFDEIVGVCCILMNLRPSVVNPE